MVRRLTPRRRRAVRAVWAGLVCAALLAVTACGTTVAGTPTAARTAPSASGTQQPPASTPPPTGSGTQATGPSSSPGPTTGGTQTPAPVPAGLEQYYDQQVQWGACTDFATDGDTAASFDTAGLQCGFLTVPLSYDDPAGQQIKIALLKAPATGDKIGTAFFNFGGPGVAGTDQLGRVVVAGYGADLRQRFDLIGFDPRGVGKSLPAIRCRTDAERDADRAENNRLRSPEEIADADARVEEQVRRCVERTGADDGIDGATFLGTIGTTDVVKDLDIARAAAGDPQLTYVGFSYGTRLGSVYAETFPANVRAMVLDGAVDPTADREASLIGQAEGFQKAFENFAAWCAKRADCVLGPDPSQAVDVYRTILKPLLDKPLELPDGRVLTAADAITGTIQALYAEAFWEPLATGLANLSQGDGQVMMAIADQYEGRDAKGHYETTLDALVAIRCMDDTRVTREQAQQIAEKYAAAAPFMDLGDPVVATANVCDFWPAEPTLSPRLPEVDGLAPVLVVSTTNDPATPYQAGVKLAEALHGTLLTIEGTRHTGYLLSGITCADDIGTAYLVDLTLPADGTVCQ